jgi:hypothetical protein
MYGCGGIAPQFLTSTLDGPSGQLHIQTFILLEKYLVYLLIQNWFGTGASLDAVE